jgi:hypothetical protein
MEYKSRDSDSEMSTLHRVSALIIVCGDVVAMAETEEYLSMRIRTQVSAMSAANSGFGAIRLEGR